MSIGNSFIYLGEANRLARRVTEQASTARWRHLFRFAALEMQLHAQLVLLSSQHCAAGTEGFLKFVQSHLVLRPNCGDFILLV